MRLQVDPAPSIREDEEEEYEVEQILEARILWGKLKFRVKWVGYDEDPKWYNAANFKNSPHKLCNFHENNAAQPGPSKKARLLNELLEGG